MCGGTLLLLLPISPLSPTMISPPSSKLNPAQICPQAFNLRGSNDSARFFKLPYRLIFAVATLNSLYIYDTESVPPIAILAGLHYAPITDIAWSPSAKFLALSSQDGYCTLVEFENDELGSPISLSEVKKVADNDNKSPVQTSNDMVTKVAEYSNFVVPDNTETEGERSKTKQDSTSTTNTPKSNKPAKRHITFTAISPP